MIAFHHSSTFLKLLTIWYLVVRDWWTFLKHMVMKSDYLYCILNPMCCSVSKCIKDCKVIQPLVITFSNVFLPFLHGLVVHFRTVRKLCPWLGGFLHEHSFLLLWAFCLDSDVVFPLHLPPFSSSVSILCSKGSVMPSIQPQDGQVASSSGATHIM